MKNTLVALAGVTLMSASALAQQPACVTQNMGVPPNANTTDKAAPFYIDTTGLDFSTKPPTRDPKSANYPRATELPDGQLPPPRAGGKFIIVPTHNPAPDTTPKDGVAKGTTVSLTPPSKDSLLKH